MQRAILGRKIGMTQYFTPEGKLLPVSVIQASPNVVCQIKTVENDGYSSVQVGFGDIKEKRVKKPAKGHFAKADVAPKRVLREFRLTDSSKMSVGDQIAVDIFKEGEKVDVTGISKGKGFAGSIKRHGNHRGPTTHGSHYHRGPGSLGACATPGKVMKGAPLPGHAGCLRVTVPNLLVVKVDKEKEIILVKGAIPGPKGAVVTIKNTVKA